MLEKHEDWSTISSLSLLILEYTKKIDKEIITGNKIGIICGIEFMISFKKIRKGRFLLIINSIN